MSCIPFGIQLDCIPNGRYNTIMETKNRETIIDTALELFALQGYEATGIQEIVDKAGITKPTLYHYFGNKRGLLDSIIATYGGKMYALIDRGAAYNHDITANLTVLAREMINFALTDQVFYRLFLALSSTGPGSQSYAASQTLRNDINERLERLFIEASADHGNMKNREKAYSRTFMGLINTWAILVINTEIELNDATLNRIVHQFMHGIFS